MADSKNFLSENWSENKEYLNWPGLQYLWYTKFKPAIYAGIAEVQSEKIEMTARYDDENWYCSFDPSTGQVYIALADDNSIFVYDSSGNIGSILENDGMLQVMVNAETSKMVDGFIDDHVGSIGNDSDQIGDATGKLYVNFEI